LQLGFGADILWRHRRLVLGALLPTTLYLSLADAIAINLGTWTINPQQSLHLLLGGVLPVEEAIFFLLTNTLLTFGLVLFLAPESRTRLAGFRHLINTQYAIGNT
jgi:lycopene cyclase domain-containing protein